VQNTQNNSNGSDRIELARKCLWLICKIAARGGSSQNPDRIGYALQELTQVLVERTGTQERLFEPVSADEIQDLPELHETLKFIDSISEEGNQDYRPIGFQIRPVHPC
jgi:hypothetical protein